MLLATANLIIHILLLIILFSAYILKRRGAFLRHGTLMLVAVVLHTFSFLLAMGPALWSLVENGLIQNLSLRFMVTLAHASVGGIALSVGIWLVGSWHLQSSTKNCSRRKIVMRYVFVLWVLALILGITLFTLLYVPI
jgi:hypothetical protein